MNKQFLQGVSGDFPLSSGTTTSASLFIISSNVSFVEDASDSIVDLPLNKKEKSRNLK